MQYLEETDPLISKTYEDVKEKQDELERNRQEADKKLQKLRELIEQVKLFITKVMMLKKWQFKSIWCKPNSGEPSGLLRMI